MMAECLKVREQSIQDGLAWALSLAKANLWHLAPEFFLVREQKVNLANHIACVR